MQLKSTALLPTSRPIREWYDVALLAACWLKGFNNLDFAKLYYTSFWDKFGMDINYFGMYPKTWKKVWDGSQVKAFPNPDHPPLEIFLTYPSFRTKLKNLCLFEVIFQSIWLRWKWKFISLYIVKLSWNDHDCLHNMFFGSISVCIS